MIRGSADSDGRLWMVDSDISCGRRVLCTNSKIASIAVIALCSTVMMGAEGGLGKPITQNWFVHQVTTKFPWLMQRFEPIERPTDDRTKCVVFDWMSKVHLRNCDVSAILYGLIFRPANLSKSPTRSALSARKMVPHTHNHIVLVEQSFSDACSRSRSTWPTTHPYNALWCTKSLLHWQRMEYTFRTVGWWWCHFGVAPNKFQTGLSYFTCFPHSPFSYTSTAILVCINPFNPKWHRVRKKNESRSETPTAREDETSARKRMKLEKEFTMVCCVDCVRRQNTFTIDPMFNLCNIHETSICTAFCRRCCSHRMNGLHGQERDREAEGQRAMREQEENKKTSSKEMRMDESKKRYPRIPTHSQSFQEISSDGNIIYSAFLEHLHAVQGLANSRIRFNGICRPFQRILYSMACANGSSNTWHAFFFFVFLYVFAQFHFFALTFLGHLKKNLPWPKKSCYIAIISLKTAARTRNGAIIDGITALEQHNIVILSLRKDQRVSVCRRRCRRYESVACVRSHQKRAAGDGCVCCRREHSNSGADCLSHSIGFNWCDSVNVRIYVKNEMNVFSGIPIHPFRIIFFHSFYGCPFFKWHRRRTL